MNNRFRSRTIVLLMLLAIMPAGWVQGQIIPAARDGFLPAWGDQGNGIFRNPVVAGDFSDPDVIRVGDDYYGVSSTLQESPGMVVIHSRDLVHWEIVGHVVADISVLSPELNCDSMKGYNQGVYAGSLRYHHKQFYCHFTSKKNGWFVGIADRPEGPWTISQMTDMEGRPLSGNGWDDNCPLWDEDGSAYIIASNFGKYEWCPRIFKMSADGKQLLDGRIADKSDNGVYLDIMGGYITHPYRTSEANKLFKRNGYYYFFFSEVRKADRNRCRIPALLRSKTIYGPYELKELLHSQGAGKDLEPNQGSLVDSPDGKDWYFITHHGAGHFSGRFLSVLPVEWVNDWPVVSDDLDNDGVGEMVWEQKMPKLNNPGIQMQTSDDFSAAKLGVQWQWNHQPRADKWSLSERRGYLRLHAFKPRRDKDFFQAGNTLGQRYYRIENSIITARLDIEGMADGQEAGLCQYDGGLDYSSLGVVMNQGEKKLVYQCQERGRELVETAGAVVAAQTKTIYFRMKADFEGKCQFEYSLDNQSFTAWGGISQLGWGWYRGARLGIYNYNRLQEAGWVDVDWFEYNLKIQ